jgi:hypothetical protein
MPGYLTQAKVLIDTVDWLSAVEDKLQQRIWDKKPLSELENTIFQRAQETRRMLRYKPHIDAVNVSAPASTANIKPTKSMEKADKVIGVGHGISRYAFAGTLGPDFPAAANILAINQRWVSQTMHGASPKTSWVKAGSTKFVFSMLEEVLKLPSAGKGPGPGVTPLRATVLGHCASVAAHVVLHPFISYVLSQSPSLTQFDVETALDAQLAVGFFQRDDLNSGDSWTDYYLKDQEDWTPVIELYLQAFQQTYPGAGPAETLCALPSLAQLEEKFSNLSQLIAVYKDVGVSLTRYQGYDKLFASLQPLAAAVAKKEFDAAVGVRDFLKDYRCRVPKLDHDFLDDGYRNTLKWAIDEGYDKGPALFRWLWFIVLAFEAWYVVFKTVGGLSSFSTILEKLTFGAFTHPSSKSIAAANKMDWQSNGLASFSLYLDPIGHSYDPGLGNILTYFNFLISGIPVVWSDGIFGQGTSDWGEATKGEKAWKISKLIYKILKTGTGEIVPTVTESDAFKVIDFVLGFVSDVLDADVFGARDDAKGAEGDILGKQLWLLQLMLWPFFFVACFVALCVKSKQTGSDGKTEIAYTFWDFLISQIFAVFASCLLIFGLKQFEKRIIGVAGVQWPSIDTTAIDSYLKLADDGKLKKLQEGSKFKVQLFPTASLVKPAEVKNGAYPDVDGNLAFPDAKASKSYPPAGTNTTAADYGLLQLFDHTKYLSALMAMTTVKYFSDSPDAKKNTRTLAEKAIVDWNLDFRTEDEWTALMGTLDGKKMGLLTATETWWNDLNNSAKKTGSDPAVLQVLQSFFGAKQTTGAKGGKKVALLYEDGSPMANAEFVAVFGDTRVPGQTDDQGIALIDAPVDQGDTYRLFLNSYPQEQVVKGA